MTGGSEGDSPEAFPPEEAFALIGDELRADILRVLGEAPHEGLSFSELRERVDGDVDSGQFNYHLQQLVGHFVENTDDGYKLRQSGLSLYRAIQAGSFNRQVTLEPFPVGFDCYFCEAGAEAVYEDGAFRIRCPGCDHLYVHMMVPPSAVTDDQEALLSRVDQYNRRQMLQGARGVCPICVNPMELGFLPGEEVWSEGAERHDLFVHRSCGHCGREQFMTVGMVVLEYPEVVSFFYEHGHDLTGIPHWELEWVMTDNHTRVRSEDPLEVELSIVREAETLKLVVDDELNVVEERYV